MKNMKVSMKLIVSFLIVTLLAVAIGGIGIFSLTSAADNTALLSDRTEIAVTTARLNRNIQAQRAAFRGAAIYHVMGQVEKRDNNLSDIDSLQTDYTAMRDSVAASLTTESGAQFMAEIDAAYAPFADARDAFTASIIDPNVSDEEMVAELDIVASTIAPLATAVTALVDSANDLTTQMANEAAATATRTTYIMVGILIAVVAISMFLAFYISGLISKPLKDMMGYIKQAGETGNLHFRDDEWENCDRLSKGKDEIGQTMAAFTPMMRKFMYYGDIVGQVAAKDLTVTVETLGEEDTFGNALKAMVSDLSDMFMEIKSSTNQVATGSTQIADGAQMLAQGSTQQAATVQQLSASIQEISRKTEENAGMAEQSAKLAGTIMQNAEKGSRQMDEMTTAVNEINTASQNIGKVIKAIDDIAFQTNILALNAAVEAARAGQHGKGFAVVADEVRSLAAKSAEAAKDTGELIASSIEKAQLGARIAEETAASLTEIVAGINESTKIAEDIAHSSQDQTLSINQINDGIEQVAQVVQQNSATAEQSAASSEELSSQAAMLEQLISQFRLNQNTNGDVVSFPVPSHAKPSAGSTSFSLASSMSDKY